MVGVAAIPTPMAMCVALPIPGNCFPGDLRNPVVSFCKNHSSSLLSTFSSNRFSFHKDNTTYTHFCIQAVSSSSSGYREKVFAIIGVKVYAAGLYVNKSLLSNLSIGKGQSAVEIQGNSTLFNSIFQAPLEKTLQIVLVRDVDGKTFWDALDDAISPRIKAPTPVDESALSTFRSIFQGRSLKKGTFIFLTWLDPSKMLVSVSSDGLPSGVDATIKSTNVTFTLFDVFFGDAPVSPSLKASVANGWQRFSSNTMS